MSGQNRLPPPAGLLVAHEQPVRFRFEDRTYQGLAGDTIASALAANDVWLLSRSFKYHRPRGVLTMAGQDANTLVQLVHEPNVPADREPLREGLEVYGQHYTGSLERDRDARLGRLARFLPVGFYYKAFFKPKGAWKFWEPVIRRKAGLGRIAPSAPHGYYDKAYGFCDVAVVGGGPAGMTAALAAARAGAEVLLMDENPVLGGALTYARFDAEGERAERARRKLVAAVEAEDNIEVMNDAVCNGWFPDNWLPVIQGNRMYKIRAREVIVASGAVEQPAVFRNNDLPGIMQGSAAQRLIRLYGVRPGHRALVLTVNRDGYAVALDLLDAGVEVAAVVDLRERLTEDPTAAAVFAQGVRVMTGHAVGEALGARGGRHVAGARVSRVTVAGQCEGPGESITCDLLCMSAGYTPTYQLLLHAGARLGYDESDAAFALEGLPPHLRVTGSVAGVTDLEAVLTDGRYRGWQTARALGYPAGPEPEAPSGQPGEPLNHPWPIFSTPKGKDFVDFDEDLQVSDILNACAEGYEHLELVKRFSTVGMGPSQGRHSALNTARLVARASARSVAETGVTTARPPFSGEKLAHCAGRSFEPERRTSMHRRHLEAGAQMMIAGLWLRPGWYGPADERERCMQDEALNVRHNVGLIDVSTLGGLDVRGPDAGEFLNRMYTYGFAKQPVGRARYAAMTNEQGVLIDDGVACRFHEHLYYVTATTAGAENVYRNMLLWNAQWRLDVDIGYVTSAWCGVNMAGPRSREVLARVCDDVDLSGEGFPYMGVREGTVAGIPARIMRVGFVGELGYEVHAPAGCGEGLWDRLMQAGADFGIRPFGLEAQRLLRLEKGHIIIGQDTDSMTQPHEVHLGWAISRRKAFFVGGRSVEALMERPLTRKLVGFTVGDPAAPAPEECHLVIREGDITGRVTSCARSATIGRPIGLAYVAPDQAEPGSGIQIRAHGGTLIEAEVVPVPFYDPENERQNM